MDNRFSELVSASQKVNERNDCGVKALAVVSGRKYNSARRALAGSGRRSGRGTSIFSMQMSLGAFGLKMEPLSGHAMNKAKTIRTLKKVIPSRGNFLVHVKGHILAIRGGEIHDWSEDSCRRIKQIWRVKAR